MLDVHLAEGGDIILIGRFDAAQAPLAASVFDRIDSSAVVDCSKLEYISSAGIGVLLAAQKRLGEHGKQLALKNLNSHIAEIFKYAGLDQIFKIS